MEGMSLGAFFEALFKYGKDYGLTLWHFLGLAGLGVFLWVATRIAQGAGKAVTGAQGVYLGMIKDLQNKADADRDANNKHLQDVQAQLDMERVYNAKLQADLQKERDERLALARETAALQLRLASLTPAHDGASDGHAIPSAS